MYQHIFFDLDRTLWDFETNSNETLIELAQKYNLIERGIDSIENFIQEYLIINDALWVQYGKSLITKETLRFDRFHKTFLKYNIDDKKLVENIGNDYVAQSPYKTNLFPHTHEVLDYLSKKYTLHIITNGFEEVQHIKIKNCGIENYFSEIITSERAGYKKPDTRIFKFSLDVANATISNSLMVGDNLEADIIGAKEAGIHQVYFNPNEEKHSEKITYEIKSLKQLLDFL